MAIVNNNDRNVAEGLHPNVTQDQTGHHEECSIAAVAVKVRQKTIDLLNGKA